MYAIRSYYANMTEGSLTAANIRNMINLSWEVGWHEVEETEWEGLLKYSRYINRFFSLFAGVDLLGEEDELDETRGVAGIHYLLPLNIESEAWIDTDGGARVMLENRITSYNVCYTKLLRLFPKISYIAKITIPILLIKWEFKLSIV